MKNIIGVEEHSLLQDFEEGMAKLKAYLKDGDEADIVYIPNNERRFAYIILVKGKLVPNKTRTRFTPSIEVNEKWFRSLGLPESSYKDETLKLIPYKKNV